MNSQSDPARFNVDQLSRLLNLYRDHDEAETDADSTDLDKTRLLRDLLSEVLPLSPDVIKNLPVILQRLHREMPRIEGRTLLALLSDPGTSLQDLQAIKEYAKAKTTIAEAEIGYEASGAVYYGAIAAALVFRNQRISRSSYQQLHEAFSSLNTKGWIVPDLQGLFERARECCTRMVSSHHDAPS